MSDRKEQLVTANHILANEGIVRALGHVSVREPGSDTMLISQSVSPKLVREDLIIEVPLDEHDGRTYNEAVIHRAIYRRRDDIAAVVHHHAPAIMPFAISGVPIRPVVPSGVLFRDGVPVFEDYDDEYGRLIVTEAEGDRMAENLGDCRAQLLLGHGANVVGASVEEAVVSTIRLDQNARHQFSTLQIGEPRYYLGPETSVAETERMLLSAGVIGRMWDYFESELPAKQ